MWGAKVEREERRPGLAHELHVRPILLERFLEQIPGDIAVFVVGPDRRPAVHVLAILEDERGNDRVLIDRHAHPDDFMDTLLGDELFGQSVGCSVGKELDALQLGEHGSERHGDAARVGADEEVRAPVRNEQPRIAHAGGGAVLVVHEPDLDLAAEDAAGGIDFFGGHRGPSRSAARNRSEDPKRRPVRRP